MGDLFDNRFSSFLLRFGFFPSLLLSGTLSVRRSTSACNGILRHHRLLPLHQMNSLPLQGVVDKARLSRQEEVVIVIVVAHQQEAETVRKVPSKQGTMQIQEEALLLPPLPLAAVAAECLMAALVLLRLPHLIPRRHHPPPPPLVVSLRKETAGILRLQILPRQVVLPVITLPTRSMR